VWPPPKRSWNLDWKFSVPTGISLVALTISIAMAYFNVVRQVDRISVVLSDPPMAFRPSEDKLFMQRNDMTLSFINSGNRPAIILKVWVLVIQPEALSTEDCGGSRIIEMEEIDTTFEPSVVKPGDVLTRVIRMTRPTLDLAEDDKPEGLFVNVTEDRVKNEQVPVELCYEISLATPSQKWHHESVPITKYEALVMHGGPGIALDFSKIRLGERRPNILIDQVGTIFDR
jgi:hypothetical protein